MRGILGDAGRAVNNLASIKRQDRLDEDQENIGIANIKAGEVAPAIRDDLVEYIREQNRTGNIDALTPEALNEAVRSRIDAPLAEFGLNQAGEDYFRRSMSAKLNEIAFGTVKEIQTEALVERQVNIAGGLPGATTPEEVSSIVAALRETDPNLDDNDIARLASDSLKVAADTGNKHSFDLLSGLIPDGPLKTLEKANLTKAIRRNEDLAENEARKIVDEAVDTSLRKDDFGAALQTIEQSGLSNSDKLALTDSVEARQNQYIEEQRFDQVQELNGALFKAMRSGNKARYNAVLEAGKADGIFDDIDIAQYNANFGASIADTLNHNASIYVTRLQNATSESERASVFKDVDMMLATAEHAHTGRKPGELGSITPQQFARVRQTAEPIINAMLTEEKRQELFAGFVQDSFSMGGSNFDTVKLADGSEYGGPEAAAEVASAYWKQIDSGLQEALSKTTDENERARLISGASSEMTAWLAKNPKAILPEWKEANVGFIGKLFSASMEPENAEMLPAAREAIQSLAGAAQRNLHVLKRHVSPETTDLLNYVRVINDSLDLDNDSILRLAVEALTKVDGPVQRYKLSDDDDEFLEKSLNEIGLGTSLSNYRQMRSEAAYSIETLASLLPNNLPEITKIVTESMKVDYRTSNGFGFRVNNAGLGYTGDYELVSKVIRDVHGRPDAVLHNRLGGRYRLYERDGYTPIEGVPPFTNADLDRISSAYSNASRTISEHKGRNDAGVAKALETPDHFRFGTPLAHKGLASIFASKYMEGVEERYAKQHVELNTRDLDVYEKAAVKSLVHDDTGPAYDPNPRIWSAQ
ncbi:MAG: hypothetical protein P1V36_14530, partial [Planctomycetota bacterium]|nr:hypothetical protein [Planctomycetota bacterium]